MGLGFRGFGVWAFRVFSLEGSGCFVYQGSCQLWFSLVLFSMVLLSLFDCCYQLVAGF